MTGIPFGHPRIEGRLRLPEAYRSLPRPSSAPEPSYPPDSLSCQVFGETIFQLTQIYTASLQTLRLLALHPQNVFWELHLLNDYFL